MRKPTNCRWSPSSELLHSLVTHTMPFAAVDGVSLGEQMQTKIQMYFVCWSILDWLIIPVQPVISSSSASYLSATKWASPPSRQRARSFMYSVTLFQTMRSIGLDH